MLCPYCAEEIKDAAVKCKHCGEWLNEKSSHGDNIADHIHDEDNSNLKMYIAHYEKNQSPPSSLYVYGRNEKEAWDVAIEDAPKGYKFNENRGLELLTEGKFSCPKCFSKYTDCERNIGCVVMIIIFISLGLGLIMIPFLPYKCECLICHYSWKS